MFANMKEVQNQVEQKQKRIYELQQENKDYVDRISSLDTTMQQVIKEKEALSGSIHVLEQAVRQKDEHLSKLEISTNSLSASAAKATILTNEKEMLQNQLKDLQSEYDSHLVELEKYKTDIKSANTSISAWQARHESLKAEADRLQTDILNEQALTSERKKKMRSVIDNLNAEKKIVETKLNERNINLQDSQSNVANLKEELRQATQRILANQEENQLDLSNLKNEYQNKENLLTQKLNVAETAIVTLKKELSDRAVSNVAEVNSAKELITTHQRDMEEHKAKRLAARQEMINLASALEKSQNDCEEVTSFIHATLIPTCSDHVLSIENALTKIDTTTTHIASKRFVKVGNKNNHNNSSNGSSSSTSSGSRNAPYDTPGRNPLHSSNKSKGKGNQSNLTVMEKAYEMRRELDRVHIGLTLLSQSIERLQDVVVSEGNCCSSVFLPDTSGIRITNITRSGNRHGTGRGGHAAYTPLDQATAHNDVLTPPR